ncbi:MAG: type I restriction endonuclease [Candidatus Binatia bacterium]
MSPSGYTEDRLVEQPAISLFHELGWQPVSALEESFGSAEPSPLPSPGGRGSWLGRETKSEVVLFPRLRAALERLNPTFPEEAICFAITELTRDRSAMSLAAANREVWELVRDGVKVLVPDRERGGQKTERVRVIDWDNPQANDFLVVSQMTIMGELYTCRPDLIGFVNGLLTLLLGKVAPGIGRKAREKGLPRFTKRYRFT